MLKRLLLLALAIALPSLFGAPASKLEAATGATIAPPTAPEYEGLPDLASSDVSPRFLSVSGNNNFTIPGDASGVARNVLRLTFTPPNPAARIKIAVFDGNASGRWDQRVDGVFVTAPPETIYEVFADPSNGALPPDFTTPLVTLKASQILTDDVWTELWDVASGDAGAQSGRAADGRFHFLLRTTLTASPGNPLSGYEINGYKLAFNGTYVLPKGNVLGFTGGAIDGLVVLLPGETQFLTTNDPYPNAYNGTFEFAFDPSNFCEDFEAFNGDADWNRPLDEEEQVDGAPTGVPPDNGIPYINPQPPAGLRDASLFRLGNAVQYQFVRPDASVFYDSETGSQTGGRPSIDQGQEGVAPQVVTGFAPFQRVVFDEASLKVSPGRWTFRWTGLDAHNSVFIKFNQDFGTTPKIPVASGRVWCDDGDLTYEQGEFVFANTQVRITPVGGPANAAQIVTTNAQGVWTLQLLAGSYDIEFVNPPCASARVNLPGRFLVDACTGGKFDIPLNCALTASGHVFCDAAPGDKVFGAGDTPLAGNVTIRLEKQGTAEFVEVQSTGTTWSAPNLSFGTWNAFVKTGQFTDSLTKTSTQPQTFTLDAATCSKTGIDFGYVCNASLCVNLFCDYDNNCQITQGDLPLQGVLVTATLFPGGVPIAFPPTDATGRACLEVAPGNYILTVLPNQAALQGASLKQGPIDFVTVGSNGAQAFFCYECFGQICGTVYLNKPNCDGVFNPVTDQGLGNIQVNLWRAPKTVADAPDATVLTQANGSYCFTQLRAGSYLLRVADGQPALVGLTPTQPVQREPVLATGQSIVNQDFGYCRARLYGKVFKELCTNTCDGIIDGNIVPFANVPVSLVGTNPVRPPQVTLTNATGDYEFVGLLPGQYAVSIDGSAPVFANLTETSSTNVGVTLLEGDEVMVNFPWCECPKARVYGYVYRNPYGDCDEVLDQGDTTLTGVKVTLTGQVNGGVVAAEDFTDGNGFYSFENLTPGTYTVTVDGQDPQVVNLHPATPGAVGPFALPAGGERRVDFGFCPQRLFGFVYRNPLGDCDEVLDAGDTVLQGVRVLLTGLTSRGPVAQERFTDAAGQYEFNDLLPGTYTVAVDGQSPVLVALSPGTPISVGPFALPPGGQLRNDFGFCPQRLFGWVYKNGLEDCDEVFDAGDLPLGGVRVTFTGVTAGGPVAGETFTDATGFYEFVNIPAGTYTVSVAGQNPVLVNLSPATPVTVGPRLLPAGLELRSDFGFCEQKVCGKVFRNPPCECNPTYEPGDTLLEDIVVQILFVSGPEAGKVLTTTTGPDGRYCFTGLPVGSYEISVPDQGGLAGLTLGSDAVLSVTLTLGQSKDGYDFAYCMPGGETKLCAKVFCEPKGTCDGIFDEGRDTWMRWVEVFVALPNDNSGYLASGFTDETGKVCFEGLPAGDYIVYVGSNQAFLSSYRPSTPDCVPVQVKDCEQVEVRFGYCQECKPGPCCEGDLHTVLVGTAFWVGDCTSEFNLKASFGAGCDCGCNAAELDRVALTWWRHFPGETTGANETLTLVDVKVSGGVAYVVLKVDASRLPGGVFGTGDYKLKVTLNGTTFSSCAKLRCESFRPGMYFTYERRCGRIPDCDNGWRWDGRSCWDAPWLSCGWRCASRFLVLDTWSHETQHCTPVVVCRR